VEGFLTTTPEVSKQGVWPFAIRVSQRSLFPFFPLRKGVLMKLLMVSVLLGSALFAGAHAVYRKVRVWRFRRLLKKVPDISEDKSVSEGKFARWIRHLDVEQGIALRKVLLANQISTEVKIQFSEMLLSHGKFSRCMPSDYLMQLTLNAEPGLQKRVAELALEFARSDKDGVWSILKSLDQIPDPVLMRFFMIRLAAVVVLIPRGSSRHFVRSGETEQVAVAQKMAVMLGSEDAVIRRTAADLLNSVLSDSLSCTEGIFMELLRTRPSQTKQSVAEVVLANKEQLKAALCCVRVVADELSPELRARV
jgi:hypothetical protein